MAYRTPGFLVPDYLLEFAQIHIHWVSDAVQPSLCCPLLLLPSVFPSIRVFSNELALCLRWPKYWSFSISASNGYPGLISFRINWFDLLAAKGLSRILSSTTIQKHQFFIAQPSLGSNLTSIHDYWIMYEQFTYVIERTTVLTIWTFVHKVMSLLFDMLSGLVIAFFQRVNKHFLISCLQSPSAVILEPKKIKSVSVSIISPSICHEVMGLDAMIFIL